MAGSNGYISQAIHDCQITDHAMRPLRRVPTTLKRRSTLLLLLCALPACASNPVNTAILRHVGRQPSGVRLVLSTTDYEVTSGTIAELRQEIQRVGPELGKRRFAGVTKWNFRWRYNYDRAGVGCRLHRVTVDVDAVVEMPRWVAPASADTATVTYWNGFRDRLLEHEAGHVRLAVESGREIADALRALNAISCESMAFQISTLTREAILRGNSRQTAYDRESRHGALQQLVPSPASLQRK
jgi:predicted secreted Zn-dependent protease